MFKLFEEIVSNTSWKDANELKANLKKVCERLLERDRLNFVVRNCSERMLKIFKQKCYDLKIELKETQSLSTIQSLRHLTMKKVTSTHDDSDIDIGRKSAAADPFESASTSFDFNEEFTATKSMPLSRRSTMLMPSTTKAGSKSRISVVDRKKTQLTRELRLAISEVIEEIEMSKEDVTAQAKEHISDNDLILTFHTSGTLTSFFIEAKQTANFEVIVCETAPKFTGHQTARELAKEGIKTSLVPDSAIFAVMSKVDKVIITAHGIMATGGIVAQAGALMIAHAAKAHQVPVFVLGAVYKLTPLHPIDSLTYNELLSPSMVYRTEEGDSSENVTAIVPAFDYVPPKLVDLILTN